MDNGRCRCCRPGGADRLPRQETVLQTTGGGSGILHQEMGPYNAIDVGRNSNPVSADQVVRTQAPPPRPWVLCEIRSQSFKRRPGGEDPLPRHWTVLRPIGWCGEKARLPRRKRGGDWEVLTVECQGPRPRGEDTPTSSDSPRRGYKTERSWVEPETGVRRDVEVVSGLASESQDQKEGTAASEGRHAWSMHVHTTSVAGLANANSDTRLRGTIETYRHDRDRLIKMGQSKYTRESLRLTQWSYNLRGEECSICANVLPLRCVGTNVLLCRH